LCLGAFVPLCLQLSTGLINLPTGLPELPQTLATLPTGLPIILTSLAETLASLIISPASRHPLRQRCGSDFFWTAHFRRLSPPLCPPPPLRRAVQGTKRKFSPRQSPPHHVPKNPLAAACWRERRAEATKGGGQHVARATLPVRPSVSDHVPTRQPARAAVNQSTRQADKAAPLPLRRAVLTPPLRATIHSDGQKYARRRRGEGRVVPTASRVGAEKEIFGEMYLDPLGFLDPSET
jgi:hypothetical protein